MNVVRSKLTQQADQDRIWALSMVTPESLGSRNLLLGYFVSEIMSLFIVAVAIILFIASWFQNTPTRCACARCRVR